jgi:hypothetical protein
MTSPIRTVDDVWNAVFEVIENRRRQCVVEHNRPIFSNASDPAVKDMEQALWGERIDECDILISDLTRRRAGSDGEGTSNGS